MGRNFATDLANNGEEFGLSITQSLTIHLQNNHYPPVPVKMVGACIKAIDSYNTNLNGDELITLPEGALWRGQTTSPAWALIEGFHLDEWCAQW